MPQKLLLIGRSGGTHLAESLFRASKDFLSHISTQLIDVQPAYEAPKWYR